MLAHQAHAWTASFTNRCRSRCSGRRSRTFHSERHSPDSGLFGTGFLAVAGELRLGQRLRFLVSQASLLPCGW